MRIRIEYGNYYYKGWEGREFEVVEKFDLLTENVYFIKGREDEADSNWFWKNDCKILDEDYLTSIKSLRLEERLKYYKIRIAECEENSKLYKSKEYKEKYEGEANILYFGSLCRIGMLSGKVELLEGLLGIKKEM